MKRWGWGEGCRCWGVWWSWTPEASFPTSASWPWIKDLLKTKHREFTLQQPLFQSVLQAQSRVCVTRTERGVSELLLHSSDDDTTCREMYTEKASAASQGAHIPVSIFTLLSRVHSYMLQPHMLGVFLTSFITFRFIYVFVLCVYVSCLHIHISTVCMPGVHSGQKRASDHLELQLMRHYEGVLKSLVPYRINTCSYLLKLSIPTPCFFDRVSTEPGAHRIN